MLSIIHLNYLFLAPANKCFCIIYKMSMSQFKELEPRKVWEYFEEISKIPRLSKKEEKIRKYLLDFAKKNKLPAREDSVGNIIIERKSSPGYERRKIVVLQSHMDMVGEKDASHPHNWDTDPILPRVIDGWVMANDTTLGADCGIGMAAQMAILTDTSIKAGKLECLFTVDEESGMTGAKNLDPSFMEGRILINLDSEDEGILYIGCAGGVDTVAVFEFKREPVPDTWFGYRISLTGLRGGHSGDEIHKGFGNSIRLMARCLWNLNKNYSVRIADFEGGNLRNAIPREAFAIIASERDISKEIATEVEKLEMILRNEFRSLEPGLKLEFTKYDRPESVMDSSNQFRFLNTIYSCNHGVVGWSKSMPDLVETSTNLASVKFFDKNKCEIVTTQRSSVESAKKDIADRIEACLSMTGASVTHSSGYPGWEPDLDSEILRITKEAYKNLFRIEPQIKAIHAGLECGLINKKFPGIDMISFGPTIRGAHTPEEKLDIATTLMFWKLLIDVLNRIPEND